MIRDPHTDCLQHAGRCVKTQDSMRILSVVLVGGILDGPIQEIPITTDTDDQKYPIRNVWSLPDVG
jgi:hypothetical protein